MGTLRDLNESEFVTQNAEELGKLAGALVANKRGEVAGAAAALLVKVLSGSSVLASGAEQAGLAFGSWLADNPDQRLKKAADAFERSDRQRGALAAFAAVARPLVLYGLKSLEASLAHLEKGQNRAETRLSELEDLLGQSLRGTALLRVGQGEMTELLTRVHALLVSWEASRAGPSGDAACAPTRGSEPPHIGVWRRKLSFLRVELAKTADPAQKFLLQELIAEAEQKLREYGGELE